MASGPALGKLWASMGPRLVGRGKSGGTAHAHTDVRASMGPRLVGRGKNACGYG